MSDINMNNQHDQKSESTAHYVGRKFAEYTMLYMEAKEEVSKSFGELCDSVMAAMPDWVEPVIDTILDFYDFVSDAMSLQMRRMQATLIGGLALIPVIMNPGAREAALAGGGTTGFSTGAVVLFAGLLTANSGGGGGNNEKETFTHRDSGVSSKPKNNSNKGTNGEKRVYKPSPKHDPKSGWGSPNPIPNDEVGQKLLDSAYTSGKNKQLYNYYDGKLVKFQPDDAAGGWHPYEVKNSAKEVPSDVLRNMLNDGIISKVEYKRFITNK